MYSPLVSILICSFNAEKTIRWTLESVLAQTYQNIEVLVLDNDSKDQTWEILEDYQTKDPRVKLFTVGKNLGAYAGINYLLDQTKGEYIAIQDHDDVWTPEKIEHQVAFLQHHEEFVACGTGYLEYYSANQTGYLITLSEKTNYTSVPLKNIKIKPNYLLAAIIRGGEVIIPSGNDTIENQDSVIIVTNQANTKDIGDIFE